jgi:hypothetical protein
MAAIPDRFDLWVRKARECGDPARQVDYVLGALAGLNDWHFLNLGTGQKPRAAEAEIEGGRHVLVFSDAGRIEEILHEGGQSVRPLSVITIPTVAAMTWCLERQAEGCVGLLVNPGDYAVVILMEQLRAFHAEWSRRGGRETIGFWIPSMTTEEEDFWQENGL